MTDDELERAMRALPLEAPPTELRGDILAAVAAARIPALRPWEIWLAGTLAAFACWLCLVAPQLAAFFKASGVISVSNALWLAVGVSSVWWISNLTLMPQPRFEVTNR
jgi:hypothetical protein